MSLSVHWLLLLEAARAEVAALRAENFGSEQQLEAAGAEVAALRAEAARKDEQLEAARAEVVALRAEAAQKDQQLEAAGVELVAMRAEAAQKDQQLGAAGVEVAALSAGAAQHDERLEAEAGAQVVAVPQETAQAEEQLAGTHNMETAYLKQEVRCLIHSLVHLSTARPSQGCPKRPALLQHMLQHLDRIAPPPPGPPFPLLLLPSTALRLITTKAGAHMRQVCRHLRDTSPPTALQPRPYHGISTTQLLVPALPSPARLQHVTSLDLSKAPSALVDDDALLEVARCCRHLRTLTLSSDRLHGVTFEGIAALTSLASTLQVLDLGSAAVAGPPQVHALAQLTSLRSLRAALRQGQGDPQRPIVDWLTSMQQLTKLDLRTLASQSAAGALTTLAGLPALVDLSLPGSTQWDADSAAALHGMARLTALQVALDFEDDGSEMQTLLVRGLSALTNLRDVWLLELNMHALQGLGGGLGGLPLQSLQIGTTPFGPVLAKSLLMDAIAPGGHLTRLVVASSPESRYQPIMRPEFLAALLRKVGGLQVLELSCTQLPCAVFDLLADLEGLRRLSVGGCVLRGGGDAGRPEGAYGSLSLLTQLRSLACKYSPDDGGNPLRAVGCLTNLTELELCGVSVGAGDVWRLLPLRALRRLCLPEGSSEGGAALAVLALLPALGTVEYGGGACWSGCDIRCAVAAGAAAPKAARAARGGLQLRGCR